MRGVVFIDAGGDGAVFWRLWVLGQLGCCAIFSDSSAAFSSINSLLKPKFSKFSHTFLKSAGVSFASSDFATFLEMKNLPLR